MPSNYCLGPGTEVNSHKELLLNQMQFIREKTINLVAGLSIAELDYEFDQFANTIGTLLLHIGSLEYFTLRNVFPGIPFLHSEAIIWAKAFGQQMSKKLVYGDSVAFYLDSIAGIRQTTIERLSVKNDEWLFESRWEKDDIMYNYYYKFFHLIEDEISHCGQIKIIKKRILQLPKT